MTGFDIDTTIAINERTKEIYGDFLDTLSSAKGKGDGWALIAHFDVSKKLEAEGDSLGPLFRAAQLIATEEVTARAERTARYAVEWAAI